MGENKVNRIEWIDLAKGIGMTLILLGHFRELLRLVENGHEYDPTLLFTMPLFYMQSGLFFKTYNGLFSFLRRKFSNLLYPYILLLIIGHFCEFLYSAPNWFLFSLFVNNLVGYSILFVIQRLFKGRSMYAALLIVSIILSYIAYNCHIDQSINSLLISKHIGFCESAVVGLPFFMVGYTISNTTDFISVIRGRNIRDIVIGILCIVLVLFISWLYGWADATYYKNLYDVPFTLTLLSGAVGAMGTFLLSRQIVRLPIISYFGRYSIIVLTTHMIIINMVRQCVNIFFGADYPLWYALPMIIAILLAEIVVVELFRRYLPFIYSLSSFSHHRK